VGGFPVVPGVESHHTSQYPWRVPHEVWVLAQEGMVSGGRGNYLSLLHSLVHKT
jgi:hypothetical protein